MVKLSYWPFILTPIHHLQHCSPGQQAVYLYVYYQSVCSHATAVEYTILYASWFMKHHIPSDVSNDEPFPSSFPKHCYQVTTFSRFVTEGKLLPIIAFVLPVIVSREMHGSCCRGDRLRINNKTTRSLPPSKNFTLPLQLAHFTNNKT